MTGFVRTFAAALLASLLAPPLPAHAAKPAATGSVCGTVRLDTAYTGSIAQRLADVVQLAAVTADNRIVGRVRFGREKVRDTFRLLPYAIAGLPLGRRLTLAAAAPGGQFLPDAGTPRGPFVLKPGACLRADYALQIVAAPVPSAVPSPAP